MNMDRDKYIKDSCISTIMALNPSLDWQDLDKLTYEELDELRESERVACNARTKYQLDRLERLHLKLTRKDNK